jgi:ribosomal protein L24
MNCRLTKSNDKSGKASEKTKEKMRVSLKGNNSGRKQSKEEIEKRVKKITGLKRTIEHKIHSRNIKLGCLNPMFGKKIKESSKKMQREKLSGEFNYLTKIILNTETGIFYYGLNEASKTTNYNKGVLWSKMVRSKINKTPFIYV